MLRGTIFEKLRTKPYKIIRILELWLRKVPVGIIGYIVRVNQKVVERAIRFIKALVPKYYASLEKIGSSGSIIEIDESKFGKRKYHRGHPVDGVWVLGMVERAPSRKIVLVAVDDRTMETLKAKIVEKVKPTSTLYTDCWKAYNKIGELYENHLTVNHSKNFVNPTTGAHGAWGDVSVKKRLIQNFLFLALKCQFSTLDTSNLSKK